MDYSRDVEVVSGSPEIAAVLRALCDLTGMGFAAVARVTDTRWIACQVLDRIAFGLEPGGELQVSTTICDEIRDSGVAVYIDCVSDAPIWATHPTPILYGFESYVSLPLVRGDGSFFGTLCAIDPEPRDAALLDMRGAIEALAVQVVAVLDGETVRTR
jgi:GAF domain-containing protein